MKIKSVMLLAFLVLFLACSVCAAANNNTVVWGAGQPTVPNAGTVSGSGTYTVANGWTPQTVQMTAYPTGGGMGVTVAGAQPANGNWGPIVINNLPTGQYTIVAQIAFKNGTNQQIIGSPIAIVNVP
jgi:hypothetical protein